MSGVKQAMILGLERNGRPSAQELKLGRNWVMHEDNLQQQIYNRIAQKGKVQQCPKQSPDINRTKMLQRNLKRAAHKQMPANL